MPAPLLVRDGMQRIKPQTALRWFIPRSNQNFFTQNCFPAQNWIPSHSSGCIDLFLGLKCQWQVTELVCAYKSIGAYMGSVSTTLGARIHNITLSSVIAQMTPAK